MQIDEQVVYTVHCSGWVAVLKWNTPPYATLVGEIKLPVWVVFSVSSRK